MAALRISRHYDVIVMTPRSSLDRLVLGHRLMQSQVIQQNSAAFREIGIVLGFDFFVLNVRCRFIFFFELGQWLLAFGLAQGVLQGQLALLDALLLSPALFLVEADGGLVSQLLSQRETVARRRASIDRGWPLVRGDRRKLTVGPKRMRVPQIKRKNTNAADPGGFSPAAAWWDSSRREHARRRRPGAA